MTRTYWKSIPFERPRFEIGDRVEMFCDHENAEGQRVRGWLQGEVVQIKDDMVAVEFWQNVYLSGGWQVPDGILWCPQDSPNIRFPEKSGASQ